MSSGIKGLLILCLIFGPAALFYGIFEIQARYEEYIPPVYISYELKVWSNGDTKSIYGELTNKTDSEVSVELCNIYVYSNNEGGTVYYDNINIAPFTIQANSKYEIRLDNIKSVFKHARISKFIADGTKYELKYSSNGMVFDNKKNSYTIAIITLLIGITLTITIFWIIFYYFIKKKLNK